MFLFSHYSEILFPFRPLMFHILQMLQQILELIDLFKAVLFFFNHPNKELLYPFHPWMFLFCPIMFLLLLSFSLRHFCSSSSVLNTRVFVPFSTINVPILPNNAMLVLLLKGEFANFLYGRSDSLKYDIIWSENENLIDRFIPEILMLKVRLK